MLSNNIFFKSLFWTGVLPKALLSKKRSKKELTKRSAVQKKRPKASAAGANLLR
jgi:hypothetical protein